MLTFGNKKNFDESTLQPSTDLNALNTLRYPCVAPQITTDFNALNTLRYLCVASLSELLLHLPARNKRSTSNKPSSIATNLHQTFKSSSSNKPSNVHPFTSDSNADQPPIAFGINSRHKSLSQFWRLYLTILYATHNMSFILQFLYGATHSMRFKGNLSPAPAAGYYLVDSPDPLIRSRRLCGKETLATPRAFSSMIVSRLQTSDRV